MEETVSSNVDDLVNSIKIRFKEIKAKSKDEFIPSNEHIESILGLKCANDNPKTIDDIFLDLQCNSTVLELFKWFHTTEAYKKIIPVEIQYIPPSQDTLNNFITAVINDVKLQMLEDSISYLGEFFGKGYKKYSHEEKINAVREELFYSDEIQLLEDFYNTMDNSILGDDFPRKDMQDCFKSPYKKDLLMNMPKATFLWSCYLVNRLRGDILKSENPCKVLKSKLKFELLTKYETPNEYKPDMVLSKEYMHFRDFMLKLNGDIPLNKSLTLQRFNRNTNLLDIYLYSKYTESKTYEPIKEDRKGTVKNNPHSKLFPKTNLISYMDNRPRIMLDRDMQREDISKISFMSVIGFNNIKYHLLTASVEDIQDNIYNCPSFLVLLKLLIVPFIQQYVKNMISDKKLHTDDYLFENEELSRNLYIYNSLKGFDPSIPAIEAVTKGLAEYEGIDKTAYFYSYKSTLKFIKEISK